MPVEPWTASCGAVNTVCFRNGRAVGYNTDGPGVVESLRLRGFAPAGQAALVLGAGGAAKAAALALAQAGCRVTVCARTPEKAAALAARCGGVTVSWEDLPRAAAEHGLLLNATPLGMEGSPEFESLDFVQALPAKAVVYDLVYHPTDTALMRAAEHRGLTAVGGACPAGAAGGAVLRSLYRHSTGCGPVPGYPAGVGGGAVGERLPLP